MAARVHNVFSLAEILKIFLSETTKSIINSLLYHNNSFYVLSLCAKLYRKPLRNHRKRSNIVLFFQESLR
jgi:hypothetical protein